VIVTEAQRILVGQMTPQQAANSMAKQIEVILAKQ
jgi:ABC-type glycerol-3-phosphate transport system substrate-binding protein